MKTILLMVALSHTDAHVESAQVFAPMSTEYRCQILATHMNETKSQFYWFCMETDQ